jgi:peptide/nickel transport system permease protein
VIRYAFRRLLAAVVLVWLVASAAFTLTWAAPGDAAQAALGIGASGAEIAAERARLGLDRPFHEQYGRWLARLADGDLGRSFLYHAPVAPMVLDRAANTALLGIAALVLALALGLPPALLCALRPRSLAARAVGTLSLVALSIPPFIGTLGLMLVAARTGWFPAGGMTAATGAGWLARAADLLEHLPLPALALALPLAATFERQQARALSDALAVPAVQAARARGVGRAQIVFRHAWRLSLGPVVALGGLACAALLGGSFVVEMITAWPGLGRLTYDALRARDLYLVAGCATAGGVVLSAALLASDLLAAWVDPRLRDA